MYKDIPEANSEIARVHAVLGIVFLDLIEVLQWTRLVSG